MKKHFFILSFALLFSCSQQTEFKKIVQDLHPKWETSTKFLSDLAEKEDEFQINWQQWKTEMQIKKEWEVRLGIEQIAELTEPLQVLRSQEAPVATLHKEIKEFITNWRTTGKVLATLKKAAIEGNLPKDTEEKAANIQALIDINTQSLPNWSQTLITLQTTSKKAYEDFSKVLVKINPNLVACNSKPFHLTDFLNQYATKIEAKPNQWMYSRNPPDFKDCSGMFLRLCEALDKKGCKGYIYPSRVFHDTRALAGWFHKNGNLTLVKNPEKSSDLIQPGMVMFYGYKDKIVENFTVGMLSAPYPKGLIEHIGTVVDVEKDDKGKIIAYTIYHGRSTGKPASRTRIPFQYEDYPIYSHYGQPWLAVGFIMTPETAGMMSQQLSESDKESLQSISMTVK